MSTLVRRLSKREHLHSQLHQTPDRHERTSVTIRTSAEGEMMGNCKYAERRSPEAKSTMKTKTWTVIANTGKQAELESGLEQTTVQKPTYISAREFSHWLAAKSRINDDSLQSLFKR